MAMPLLNKKAKTDLKNFKKKMKGDVLFNLEDSCDFYFECEGTCCVVVEGYGTLTSKEELLFSLSRVEKNMLMIYHAPNIKHFASHLKLLKSVGFRQMVPEWKNGVHNKRKEGVITLMCYKDV